MENDRFLGIRFPFEEDLKGKYVRLDKIDKDKVRSNLTFLITTQKGERLRKPDFGTNVMQFIFEPLDDQTISDIRTDIIGAVTKYLAEVNIEKVEILLTNDNQHFVGLRIPYTITNGVFKEKDIVNIRF